MNGRGRSWLARSQEREHEQARDEAKSSKRFMMVTLHDPSEFACQTLNRDLWKDQSVQEVVKASFVFMQVPCAWLECCAADI